MNKPSLNEFIRRAATPRVILFLCFSTIALVGMMLYLNTLDNSFNFDDHSIYERTHLLEPGHFGELLKVEPRRFIPYVSFSWNYRWEGLNVFGYHLVNMMIHIINGMLVFWLAVLTLHLDRRSERSPNLIYGMALCAGLIFIAHPLQTQAVTYIVQRLASMAAMFYLFSVCLYLSARMQPRIDALFVSKLVAALISFALGIYSKEIVYSLPLMIALYEVLFLQREKGLEWLKRHGWKAGLGGLILGGIICANINLGRFIEPQESPDGQMITSGMYLLTQLRVLITYARLLWLPIGQNVDYDYPVFTSLADGEVVLSLIALLGAAVFTVWLTRKNKLMGLGLIWIALTLAIESSFIPLKDVIFEHRLYLPMVGFALFVTTILFSALRRNGHRAIAIVLMIAALGTLTYKRNAIWQDKFTLWSDTIKKSPYKARPYYNLGNALRERGRYEEAIEMYSRSINLAPFFTGALLNRAISYKELARYQEAVADLNRLLAKEPQNFKALRQKEQILMRVRQARINEWSNDDKDILPEEMFNRANVLIEARQYAKAIELLDLYLKKKSDDAQAFNNRGFAKAANNDLLGALNDYNQALKLQPDLVMSRFNLGMLYQRFGQFEDAIKEYDRALSIDPKYIQAYNDRGIAYMKLSKWEEAIADFDRALAIDPAFVPAKVNRQLAVKGKEAMSVSTDKESGHEQ